MRTRTAFYTGYSGINACAEKKKKQYRLILIYSINWDKRSIRLRKAIYDNAQTIMTPPEQP